ncbi:hypothetical protein JHK84_031770 [Glycine max]|nr:hypothetical protein JHK84_031770 [Glycine max]
MTDSYIGSLISLISKSEIRYKGILYNINIEDEHGLMSFGNPSKKMKEMPRTDSEGFMCKANFNVDSQSMFKVMPCVGSEANWATWS